MEVFVVVVVVVEKRKKSSSNSSSAVYIEKQKGKHDINRKEGAGVTFNET